MLILSRNKNEAIKINDDVTLVIVEIRGDKVRLGIEAPQDVVIHRQEVYDAIKRAEIEDSTHDNISTETAVHGATETPLRSQTTLGETESSPGQCDAQ